MIGHVDTPSNGQPTIGRPFYGQAKGQLRLTCAFYAECAHEGSKGAKGAEGSKGLRKYSEYSPTLLYSTKKALHSGELFDFL